jgi:hypothetical protein
VDSASEFHFNVPECIGSYLLQNLFIPNLGNFKFLNCNYRNSSVRTVTRLEIISDVVSEKARSGKIPIPHRKYRYHIGNTDTTSVFSDTTSVFSDTTSEIPIPHRFFPILHRYFRCGIGIFPLRAFPIPHRKLFLTVHEIYSKS